VTWLRRWWPLVIVLAASGMLGGTMLVAAVAMTGVTLSGDDSAAGGTAGDQVTCGQPTAGEPVALDDGEPRENAKTIVQVGLRLKVPERGLIVALATARQESTLRNLNYGDRDSLGLFQQRAPWGSVAQRTDPASAATMFFTGGHGGQRGLLDIPGWRVMSIAGAAQAVQVSAFPEAYAQWEGVSRLAVEQILRGGPAQTCTDEVVPVAGLCAATTDYSKFKNGEIPDSALCRLKFAPQHRLRSDAALAVENLSRAYKQRWGHVLCITDSYRSYPEQVDVRRRKGNMAAVPGTSKHGWGRALDLCDHVNVDTSPQWAWMRANAPAFGWQNPPWALKGGSGPYEPWHWEWET
jgi:hypothetical protein